MKQAEKPLLRQGYDIICHYSDKLCKGIVAHQMECYKVNSNSAPVIGFDQTRRKPGL